MSSIKSVRFSISLRLRHPTASASTITDAIGLSPHKSWSFGDRRRSLTGQLLPGAYKETYWTSRLDVAADHDLCDVLQANLQYLSRSKMFLRQFLSTGGSAEYFIGIFPDFNVGLMLRPQLLRRLASMNISLALDIYAGGGSAVASD